MNVAETIQQKVNHLPFEAQQEILEIVEEVENRYQAKQKAEHPLTLLARIQIDAPPDFAERHDFYAHGKWRTKILINDLLFIDTAYVYAITNPHDQWHEKAINWQHKIVRENRRLMTTQFVLTEIADGLSSLNFRRQAVEIIQILENNEFVEIVPADSELFRNADQSERNAITSQIDSFLEIVPKEAKIF